MTEAPARVQGSSRRERFERVLSAALIALIPLALTYALVHLRLEGELTDFVPSFWNDQTGYWTRIQSFGEHGFSTGYFAPDENLPALDFNRFGTQGPVFPIVYGSIAWFTGWSLPTSIFINVIAVGLALAAFVCVGRLDRLQTLMVALIAVFFGPLLLYLPTTSQESLQQVVAVVLALLFSALFTRGAQLPTGVRVAGLVFITAAGFLRFSWALLLIPALLLAFPPVDRRRLVGELALAGGVTGAVLIIFGAMNPPGQNSVLDTLSAFPDAPVDTLSTVASDSWENLKQLFDPIVIDATLLPSGSDAVSMQAVQVAALIVVAIAIATGAVARARGEEQTPERQAARREWLFHAYNLGTIVVGSIMLYLPAGYYRVIGAHLLLSLLVMIKSRRFVPVAAVLATSAVMVPSLLTVYDGWSANFEVDLEQLEADRELMASHIVYEEDPSTPWCNTLLLSVVAYDQRITTIPSGIGVSYLSQETVETIDLPLKSRYVLLREEDRRIAESLGLPLEEVGDVSFGTVYVNRASLCDEPPA